LELTTTASNVRTTIRTPKGETNSGTVLVETIDVVALVDVLDVEL
jgi:hypothetical protein